MKKRDLLCTAVFCLFLAVGTLFLLFAPKQQYSQREKRYLAKFPQVSWESVLSGETGKALEDWTADHFPFRDFFVGVDAYGKLLQGRNAQQDVYYAKDGYLIAEPASSDLTIFETSLKRFEAFSENCGIPASLILVPSTGYLKEDLLPLGAKQYPDAQMFDTAASILKQVQLCDYRDELRVADETKAVCYRTDHHLTSYGNEVLYDAWCRGRELDFLPQDQYRIEQAEGFCGTAWSGSGYWLTRADTLELWDCGADVTVTITDGGEAPVTSDSLFFRTHLQELDQYPVFLDGNHCQVEIHNSDAPEGTILLIKDSYANCFATFLTQQYETVILLDLRYYRGSISQLIAEKNVNEILFFYGTSTLLTDTNSAWLF